jgi:hypothetical protein
MRWWRKYELPPQRWQTYGSSKLNDSLATLYDELSVDSERYFSTLLAG